MYRVIWCFWLRDVKTALVECHVFAQSIPGHRLVFNQRRRLLTGIEPAMGCNFGPTLNRNWWVGLHPQYQVHRRQVLNECWLEVEKIHVEDIFELVSLVLFSITSWTFRILAHEEDQYTDFLSIGLEQTKAGLRISGTPFLVFYYLSFYLTVRRKLLTVAIAIFIKSAYSPFFMNII